MNINWQDEIDHSTDSVPGLFHYLDARADEVEGVYVILKLKEEVNGQRHYTAVFRNIDTIEMVGIMERSKLDLLMGVQVKPGELP